MDPNKKAETVATSFVPEGMPVVPGLTPEQQKTRARAKELRAIYDKTKDTDPMAALRRPEASPVSKIDTDREAERRITDTAILSEVQKWVGEAKTLSEGGLDAIAITSPLRKQEIIDAYVVQVLDLRPEFSALPPDEKKAIAEAQLNNPEVRAKLGKLISEKLSPSTTVETDVDTDRRQAVERRNASKTSKIETITAIGKANKEIGDLEDLAREHQVGDPAHGIPEGKWHKEIDDLLGKVDVAGIETLRKGFDTDGYTPEALATLRTVVEGKKRAGIAPAAGVEKRMSELIDKEAVLTDLQRLEAERDGVDDRLKQARKDVKKLEKKRNGLTQDIKDDTQTIDELDVEIKQRDVQLQQEFKQLITEAGNEAMDDETQKRFDAFEGQYEKETQAAADGDIKRLRENLQVTFTNRELKGGRPREVNRSARIQVAWNNALMSGDAAHPALAQLRRTIDQSTPEGQQEFDRIGQRFDSDPAFKKQLEEEYVTYLFQKRLEGGKPMFEGEARLIERYNWGPYVDKAVEKNAGMQQRLSSLVGTAGEAGYYQRLRSEYGNNWLSILTLLAVGAVIPGTMMARMVKQETGR